MNANNLVISNARIYVANFGATEPELTLAALQAAPTSPTWTDVGLTNGGVTIAVTPDIQPLEADQLKMRAGSVQTGEEVTVTMSLAEVTLENLALAIGNGSIDDTVDTGNLKVFTPGDATDFQVTYKALIIDGTGPGGKKRRAIVRKAVPSEEFEIAYTKEDQQVFEVTWIAHFVDEATAAYIVIDDASA